MQALSCFLKVILAQASGSLVVFIPIAIPLFDLTIEINLRYV